MIRRKIASSEAGFNSIKGVQEKVLYLPLSGEGVFGQGLQDKLEKHKDDRAQVDSLLPEITMSNKRKGDYLAYLDSYPSKMGKISDNVNSINNSGYKKKIHIEEVKVVIIKVVIALPLSNPSVSRDNGRSKDGRSKDKKGGNWCSF